MNNYLRKIWPSQRKGRKIEFGFFFKNAPSSTKKDVFTRILEGVNKEQRDIVRRYGE